MDIIILFALWIPSMVFMYRRGFDQGSHATLDWCEKHGYIEYDADGSIKDPK